METILSLPFWIQVLAFVSIVGGLFFAPGFFILSRLKLTGQKLLTLASAPAIGMVLWGAQGYVFGYAHIRWGTYIYVGLIGALLLLRRSEIIAFWNSAWRKKKIDVSIVLIIVIGVIAQCFQMFGSGLLYKDGIRFFRINAYDGVYHLNLIQSITRQFPPIEPGAVGLPVLNYHYWSDLVLAEIVRIFGIPSSVLFFQLFPIFVSVWTGIALVSLMRMFPSIRSNAIKFALILTYFAGDLGFVLSYYLHRTWSVNIPVIDNGVTQFLNMPHTVAKMLFLATVPLFILFLRKRSLPVGVLSMLLSAALFGFKIYFGIYMAVGILCSFIYTFLEGIVVKRKFVVGKEFILGILFLCLVAAIYLPVNVHAGGLTYVPLAWPRLMLAPDKLDYTDWNYRHAIYEMYKNVKGLIYLDVVAIIFCLLAIHGTRILGFFLSRKTVMTLGTRWIVFFYPATLLFTFLGFYTLQQSGGFNVFNFLAVSMTFLAISGGLLLDEIWGRWSILGKAIVIGVLLLSVQRSVIETTKMVEEYHTNIDTKTIPKDEISALTYLREHTPSGAIVQSDPDMYDYPIAYLSNRDTYYTAGDVLITHNQPTKEREMKVKSMIRSPSLNQFISEMESLKITYIIVHKSPTQLFGWAGSPGVKTVFENAGYAVYSIDRGK